MVWLRSQGLEEYEAAFRDNKINERVQGLAIVTLSGEDRDE